MIGSSDDNPFVIAPRTSSPARAWMRAAAVVGLCVAGVYGLHTLSQQWLISRLAHDLASHPPHVQVERLGMLAEFGEPGLPTIVSALASPDGTVSATAFRLLNDLQGRWQTSHSDEVVQCQETLLRSLSEVARECPPERRQRIADLVNQIVLDTVGASDEAEAEMYRRACQLLSTVTEGAPAGRAGGERVATRPTGTLAPSEDASSTDPAEPMLLKPLPATASVRIISRPKLQIDEIRSSSSKADRGSPPEAVDRDAPQQLGRTQLPAFAPVNRSSFIVTPVVTEEATVGDNPLAAYDTRSVVDFVGSVQPALQEAAVEELRKRDFSDADMELATRLTSSSAAVRLAMIAELPSRSDVDPRRWLIWLASDPERDVRLEAISRLGTMDDPEVREALRQRLQVERDPTVATRLRRFLGLR